MYYGEGCGKFRIAPLRMSARHFSQRWPMYNGRLDENTIISQVEYGPHHGLLSEDTMQLSMQEHKGTISHCI